MSPFSKGLYACLFSILVIFVLGASSSQVPPQSLHASIQNVHNTVSPAFNVLTSQIKSSQPINQPLVPNRRVRHHAAHHASSSTSPTELITVSSSHGSSKTIAEAKEGFAKAWQEVLESPFFLMTIIFMCLILTALICWCYKDYIFKLVHYIETGCYYLFRAIFFPLQVLYEFMKTLVYPMKQAWFAVYDRTNAYLHPARQKI